MIHRSTNLKEVVVYGSLEPPCGGCVIVKAKLDQAQIEYTYKDVSEDIFYQEMCGLRLRGIPAVFVDGEFMQGEGNIDKVIQEVLNK